MRSLQLIFIICFFTLTTAYGQVVNNTIVNENKIPVPYANIGMPKQSISTTTNEMGQFSFNLNGIISNDTVYVSAIGYVLKAMALNEFKLLCTNNSPICLTKTVYNLSTIIIRPNDYETKIIGNTNVANLNCERIDDLFAKHMDTASVNYMNRYKKKKGLTEKAFGFELANKIKVKKGQLTFIDAIQFKTCLNPNDTAIYRVNIYGNETVLVKKRTVIGKFKTVRLTNLLKQQLIVKTYGKTIVHNLSIASQNISVDDDFIIGVECIYASNSKMNVGTKMNIFGATDFLFRPTGNTSWIDVPLIDLTFVGVSVTVKKAKPFYKFW